MHSYERLEHTADAFVRCTGSTLEECFANAAYAMFDQTVDLRGVSPERAVHTETDGDTPEERLYNFLSELLFIQETERIFLCRFSVRFSGDSVICDAEGESLDLGKHKTRTEVKAVTYHMLDVDAKTPSVTILFDI
ncbi:MAG: protein archease [Candidatus Methanomethylophilaceae archaeon]|nr:protein archease [Candidatus Methanomethylophilaceae archaeon]